jgi:hypothetical protein
VSKEMGEYSGQGEIKKSFSEKNLKAQIDLTYNMYIYVHMKERQKIILVWYKRDLRVRDHLPLTHALAL